VLVVAEIDGAESIRIESQVTADPQSGEARKIAGLLGKSVDPREHRVVRPQALGKIEKARTHVSQPELVDQGGTDVVGLTQAPALLADTQRNAAIGLELARRVSASLVQGIRTRERVG